MSRTALGFGRIGISLSNRSQLLFGLGLAMGACAYPTLWSRLKRCAASCFGCPNGQLSKNQGASGLRPAYWTRSPLFSALNPSRILRRAIPKHPKSMEPRAFRLGLDKNLNRIRIRNRADHTEGVISCEDGSLRYRQRSCWGRAQPRNSVKAQSKIRPRHLNPTLREGMQTACSRGRSFGISSSRPSNWGGVRRAVLIITISWT